MEHARVYFFPYRDETSCGISLLGWQAVQGQGLFLFLCLSLGRDETDGFTYLCGF
jgi:hypothetical protein